MSDTEIIKWLVANKGHHSSATSLAEEAIEAFPEVDDEELFFELAAEVVEND
jgi:hypothetical protein